MAQSTERLSGYCVKLIASIMLSGFDYYEGQAILSTCLYMCEEINKNPNCDEDKMASMARERMLQELAKRHS